LSVEPNNFLVSELHHLKLIFGITGPSVQIVVFVANRDDFYKKICLTGKESPESAATTNCKLLWGS